MSALVLLPSVSGGAPRLTLLPTLLRPPLPPLLRPSDTHLLLSDVAMESDDFSTALREVDAGLEYLARVVQVLLGGRDPMCCARLCALPLPLSTPPYPPPSHIITPRPMPVPSAAPARRPPAG